MNSYSRHTLARAYPHFKSFKESYKFALKIKNLYGVWVYLHAFSTFFSVGDNFRDFLLKIRVCSPNSFFIESLTNNGKYVCAGGGGGG